MKVYPQEIVDGLKETIVANASIAYTVEAKPLNVIDEKAKAFINAFAAVKTHKDLFYLDTILATVGWNKNKDIFDKKEVWAARHTPEDKPFNLNHVQNDIIGHITGNFAVGEDYKLIPDSSSVDSLPDKYHILTSAVIYKFWEDPERSKSIATIIEEICKGEWFVSMECLFSDFDYGLISAAGEQRVLARTEESAFLTKHLAQYGGSGKYQDFSLGRVLRNITFSGKGLVKQPANPESSILLDLLSFKTTFANLGYIHSTMASNDITGDNQMSLDFEKENKELKSAIADLNKQLSERTSKAYEDRIKELVEKVEAAEKDKEKDKKDKKEKDEEYAEKAAEYEKQLKAAKDEKEKDKKEKEKMEEDTKAARDEIEKMKSQAKEADRKSKLEKAGADDATVANFLKEYADLPDKAFADMVGFASPSWKKETKTATATEVLETAKKTEDKETPSFSVDGKQGEAVNAEIHEFVKAALKQKKVS